MAETSLRPGELVLPVFVKEGISEPQPVGSMPGVVQHTRDSLRKAAAEAAAAGVGGLIVFGIPAVKDGRGSAADDPAGISQLALADLRAEIGDACVIMADLCLCEYTDHGHCGLLTERLRRNDATLERYAAIAVAQAEAGAHLVAPSGMMDGQVAAIRAALDAAGHDDAGICAYSAKYASAFYGPFREAAEGALCIYWLSCVLLNAPSSSSCLSSRSAPPAWGPGTVSRPTTAPPPKHRLPWSTAGRPARKPISTQVQPFLEHYCYPCHGPESRKPRSTSALTPPRRQL